MKPLRIVGLIGVVVFGGLLLRLALKPKPDPFFVPGALPLHESLERGQAALQDGTATPANNARDLLAIGPQEARDDLYCSGLIYAHHRASGDTMSAAAQQRRDKIIALAESGVAKLLAAGAAQPGETAAIADAHGERARQDFADRTPRFSLEECMGR